MIGLLRVYSVDAEQGINRYLTIESFELYYSARNSLRRHYLARTRLKRPWVVVVVVVLVASIRGFRPHLEVKPALTRGHYIRY